jgi:DNA-binding HxlR family transcriptional regulator
MGRYRQYCPIARAAEILGERWTVLLVRNLLMGADTFTAIARGVPTMSRSVLIKRLADLERAGVIVTTPKPGGGSTYRLTAAGRDLAGVVEQLGAWGTRWLDVTTEQCDPGFALWAWCRSQMASAALPRQRTVVAFTFPAERPANRRYWILVEDGVAELCYADPGGVPDVDVVADSVAFVEWHRGARSWADAMRSGAIIARGTPRLVQALPTWNTHQPVLAAVND